MRPRFDSGRFVVTGHAGTSGTGRVFWITGLPGSGKSTLAGELYRCMRERTPAVVRVDGDEFRAVMGNDLGKDLDGRVKNAFRIARTCQWLSSQGIHVVCATVSLYREIHAWNRENIADYFEILVEASVEARRLRDTKGLFTRPGKAGELGVDQPFDLPSRPDRVVRNEGSVHDLHGVAKALVSGDGGIAGGAR